MKRSYDCDIMNLEKSQANSLLNDDFNMSNKLNLKGTFKGVSLIKLNKIAEFDCDKGFKVSSDYSVSYGFNGKYFNTKLKNNKFTHHLDFNQYTKNEINLVPYLALQHNNLLKNKVFTLGFMVNSKYLSGKYNLNVSEDSDLVNIENTTFKYKDLYVNGIFKYGMKDLLNLVMQKKQLLIGYKHPKVLAEAELNFEDNQKLFGADLKNYSLRGLAKLNKGLMLFSEYKYNLNDSSNNISLGFNKEFNCMNLKMKYSNAGLNCAIKKKYNGYDLGIGINKNCKSECGVPSVSFDVKYNC